MFSSFPLKSIRKWELETSSDREITPKSLFICVAWALNSYNIRLLYLFTPIITRKLKIHSLFTTATSQSSIDPIESAIIHVLAWTPREKDADNWCAHGEFSQRMTMIIINLWSHRICETFKFCLLTSTNS